MKKLLKISLSLPLVIATIPLVASSCKQTNIEIKKPDDKKETANQIQAKINKEFQKNKVVQKLLSSFIENEKEQDIFVQNQNNILPNVYSELKFSLLYFPIYNRASDNPGSELYGFIRQSREIIENTLQRNWYWYLKQISNFVYSINPYNDRYIETSQTKKTIQSAQKDIGILYKIKDAMPKDIIELPYNPISSDELKEIVAKKINESIDSKVQDQFSDYLEDRIDESSNLKIDTASDITNLLRNKINLNDAKKLIENYLNNKNKFETSNEYQINNEISKKIFNLLNTKGSSFDNYSSKKIFYVAYDHKTWIRVIVYTENNVKKISINPDVYILNQSNSYEQSKEILKKLNKQIFIERLNSIIDSLIENINEKDFNIKNFFEKNNDKKFFELFQKFSYNKYLIEAMQKINKEKDLIYRYSWETVDYE